MQTRGRVNWGFSLGLMSMLFVFNSPGGVKLVRRRRVDLSRARLDELKFHSPARSGGRQITTERAQRARW